MTLQRYAVFLNLQHSHCHLFRWCSSGKPITSELHTVISSERSESRNLNHANITNIPDLIHENAPFCGQKAHFDGLIHENRRFHGREMKI
jgi:hypothetical protein